MRHSLGQIICEALILYFFLKFCKNSFWKLLSLWKNPVLHIMISLALARSASRLCPVETETAKIMRNFCAFVAYQIHRKAMTSAGCFPLWPATQMLQQNLQGAKVTSQNLRPWLFSKRPSMLQTGPWTLHRMVFGGIPRWADKIRWIWIFVAPFLNLQLLRWLQLWAKWPELYIKGFRKCRVWAWPMMCEKDGGFPPCATSVLIHRLKRKSHPFCQGCKGHIYGWRRTF